MTTAKLKYYNDIRIIAQNTAAIARSLEQIVKMLESLPTNRDLSQSASLTVKEKHNKGE